jgi:hypothetical protein
MVIKNKEKEKPPYLLGNGTWIGFTISKNSIT